MKKHKSIGIAEAAILGGLFIAMVGFGLLALWLALVFGGLGLIGFGLVYAYSEAQSRPKGDA